MGEATNRCVYRMFNSNRVHVVVGQSRKSMKVLVSTDICIVRECVYCHSTVVGYGSQIKTPLVCKLLTCSCTLVRMFGPRVIARGQH